MINYIVIQNNTLVKDIYQIISIINKIKYVLNANITSIIFSIDSAPFLQDQKPKGPPAEPDPYAFASCSVECTLLVLNFLSVSYLSATDFL